MKTNLDLTLPSRGRHLFAPGHIIGGLDQEIDVE